MKKPRTRVFHARDRFARGFENPWPVWPVDYDYVAGRRDGQPRRSHEGDAEWRGILAVE